MEKWMVSENNLQPIHGRTKMRYVDLMTGETCDEVPVHVAV
jgi:hypothetical protein